MATREEKLELAMGILDMVGGILLEMFSIIQERRGNVTAIVAKGGDISEMDWLSSDDAFEDAYQDFMEEVNK